MKNLFLFSVIFVIAIKVDAQKEVYEYFQDQMATINYNSRIGGYVLPSEGTLKILIIFAQFPDDNFDILN